MVASAPKPLQLLQLLLLAILTVVWGDGTSSGRGVAAAHDGVNGARWALAPQPAPQWRQPRTDVARPVVDAVLAAVEADIDDDDIDDEHDTRRDVADARTAPSRSVWLPGKAARAPQVELHADPSRFACTRGRPRGPPT